MKPKPLDLVKRIIFDFGGTLDTNGRHWSHVLWDGYNKCNVSVPEEHFRDAYVYAERVLDSDKLILPDDRLPEVLLKKVGLQLQYLIEHDDLDGDMDRAATEKAIADYCYSYVLNVVSVSREVLRALFHKFQPVLVTNYYGNIRSVLKGLQLDSFFVDIIESETAGIRKPDSGLLRLGMMSMGCPAEDIVVVGDSFTNDVVPAKSLGMRAIWLKGETWEEKNQNEKMANAIITDISRLFNVLTIREDIPELM